MPLKFELYRARSGILRRPQWRWRLKARNGRASDEWGDVYSMVMTDACPATAGVHDRMPVLIGAADYQTWVAGPTEAARALCVPWPGLVAIERTGLPWRAL